MNAEEQVAEPMAEGKPKKQRTEAQQIAFKAAVEKLKAKRELEREAKASARAELDLKKIEEKAQVLKQRVKPKAATVLPIPVQAPAAPAVTEPLPMADFMKQVERMLDERLPRKSHKRRERSPSSSSEEPVQPKRKALVRQERQPQPRYALAPAPAQVAALAARTMPPAWYDALFPQRR